MAMENMRPKTEHDATGDNQIYRKLRKKLLAGCSLCPWHGGENGGNYQRRANRSRKKRTRGR